MAPPLIRLGVGLGTGCTLALGLYLALGPSEAPTPIERSTERSIDSVPADRFRVELPPGLPRGAPGRVYLAKPGRSLPRSVAPVLELGRGGALRVVRAPPLPEAPGPEPSWQAAGLILPVQHLERLTAIERSVLLEVLRVWRGPRGGARPGGIELWGIGGGSTAVARLCRWAR